MCPIGPDNTQKTAEKIKAAGRRSLTIKTNASKSSDAEEMVNLTMEKFGKIDIFVNNIDIVIVDPATEYREENWNKTIN